MAMLKLNPKPNIIDTIQQITQIELLNMPRVGKNLIFYGAIGHQSLVVSTASGSPDWYSDNFSHWDVEWCWSPIRELTIHHSEARYRQAWEWPICRGGGSGANNLVVQLSVDVHSWDSSSQIIMWGKTNGWLLGTFLMWCFPGWVKYHK